MFQIASLIALLLSTYLVHGAPITTGVRLDPAATAEAHQRDDTATRAFTATQIKTSDGQCFFVDPTSGDFRSNLTPVQIKPCDGSPGQKWDVITAGKHNNVPGFALVVSSLTNACLNFDPRRQPGNQVILFSCGGRADGSGGVTDSQLFPFTAGQTSLVLQPKGGNNAVCLVPVGGLLDQAGCSGAADQVFTIGEGAVAAPPKAETTTSTTQSQSTPSITPVSVAVAGVKTGVKLDPAAVAEAQQRDDTATRAFTGAAIRTSDGQCLFVDPTSGDFRENLTPVQIQPCDGTDGQKWDVITAGKHNDKPGFALIVSSLTNACLNFDDRRAPGNQVLLFSCGGRADGSGQVQEAQLFPFKDGQTTLTLQPSKGNNVCFVPKDGLLDSTTCSGAANQVFTIDSSGSGTAPNAAPSPATSSTSTEATSTPIPSVTIPVEAPPSSLTSSTTTGTASTPTPSAVVQPVSQVKTGVQLNPAAVAEAHQRDDTATRAFTGAAIKTSEGQCFFVDPTSGDFRQNLTPVQIRPCDGSPNEKWDVITAGKHNDKPGFALIVSSLTNACLNFDDRRAPGTQVILFSCGGRADGSGEVQDAQLFPFKDGQTTLTLQPSKGNNVCLVPSGGLLDVATCSGAADQSFTIVP